MGLTEILPLVLAPVLTAVVAGVGVLLRDWRLQRRWEPRQRLILEHGVQDVLHRPVVPGSRHAR